MKNPRTPNRRAFAALIPATLLLAAPGFAQDVPATTPPAVQTAPPVVVTPPPVVPTVSDAAPATPPAAEPTTTTTATRTTTTTARTRTAQAARPATRPVRTARAPAPAEAAPAPAAVTPAEAPAVTPAPAASAPEIAAPAAPAAEAAAPAPATTTETTTEAAPVWPWVVGLLALLGAIGLFVMRRRRSDTEAEMAEAYYEEPYAAEPEAQPVAAPAPIRAEPAFAPAEAPQFLRTAPIAEADEAALHEAQVHEAPVPVAAEESTIVHAEAAEVADLTAADAPVADRPWLEFALRPVRAGISADEAVVEIELTVGNSGSVKAEGVRISTFLFATEPGSQSEMERLLIERGDHHDDSAHPITIEPGEGARVDATLALPKAQLMETTNGSILPVVIVDARYMLADGREGRTSASFTIGLSEEGTPAMSPFMLAERGMHDEVEARLYGHPEHA